MLKTHSEALFKRLVNGGGLIKNAEERNNILRACKNVRAKDYVFAFDVPAGAAVRDIQTTTANWHFVLCGVSCYFHDSGTQLNANSWPMVSIKFENFAPASPYGTPTADVGRVPSVLCFGREGLNNGAGTLHFEEAANLFFDLGQRFTMQLEAKGGLVACRGVVCLTGIEISNEALTNGEL